MAAGPVVLPENFPIGCGMGGNAAGVENQDLRDARENGQPRRAITRSVRACSPDKLAVSGVIGYEGTIVSAAGVHHHEVVNHQRRATHAPFVYVRLVVLNDILGPDWFSGFQVQTVQDSGRTQS